MTHRAPSATAGGAFAFSGSVVTSTYHKSVLADVVRAWAEGSRRAVDATLGGGGHAALLVAAGAQVLAVDRDTEAIAAARARLGEDGIRYASGAFASAKVLGSIAAFRPDRILLDLGVSSHQLDAPERGFTFRPGAPLDMRMTPGQGVPAAELLNSWPADRLARCFADYADAPPPRARRLARVIVKRRARAPFAVSDDLVNAIRETLGPRSGPADFARIFQALRIVVNQELEQIELALPALRAALQPGGRLGVISYHSGEDRIVKHAFRDWSKACVCPPRQPVCTCRGRALGRESRRAGAARPAARAPPAVGLRDYPAAAPARRPALMAKLAVRLRAVEVVVGGALVCIAGRAAQLQLLEGRRWAEEARAQRTEHVALPARRGALTDRHGTPLALTPETYDDGRGASGLERALDSLLAGRPGAAVVLKDRAGREYESPARVIAQPVAGADVALTLDAELQEIAQRALDDAIRRMDADGGDVVMMDPATGEGLAVGARGG